MDIIKEIICSLSGTIAFAVIMKAPKRSTPYIALGALITSTIERVMSRYYGEMISCIFAMICLTFFCEAVARKLKQPTTITLMPSVIPLLPGSSIYYAMLYAVEGNTAKFVDYGKSTLLTGIGIAVGAIISSAVVKIISRVRS